MKALAADAYEVLDRDWSIRAEPALAHVRSKIFGVCLPKDDTRDYFKITKPLAKKVDQLGICFSCGSAWVLR
ncbi:MAG: hypothetical protein E5V60_01315 [Mesorhizobium sp.]|uniref:hypothetical protein n=1 Tax=Mesorhizobium sp. TaxID=1871066 RepID=UPI00121E48E9|nr:hypothetical protein [Mesorhizobium sp.]TIW69284.1 MAG: hypothetical protein E5V60_01315 [Mesorhizobium sp.]